MNKTAIKNFAIWARNKLIKEITYKAGLVGVTEKGIADALPQSTKDMQWFDIGTSEPSSIQGDAIKQREKLVQRIREKERDSDYKTAYTSIVEEVAYTWFNRLIAIRFMEVNDYLPSRVRVLSSETVGKEEPDLVTTPFESDLEFTSTEADLIMQYKDMNQLDELFRMLFIKQCNKLNEILPKLFERTKDYTELLLNISFTDKDGIVSHLVNDIQEDDFKEAVEIIGWLYQYYNEERKNEVINIYKGTIKKEDIPAATQLFTTDWVVRYMVDNSLGRYWIERNPESKLFEKLTYFVTPKDGQLHYVDEKVAPEELTFFDPCMGSGHILVYAFEVLMEIYRECGYVDRDAALAIVENNLFGLDIDERAYQLAYFAVMMKARSYDRRFLTREINPNVYPIYDYTKTHTTENADLNYLISEFSKAKQYGSLINFRSNFNLDSVKQYLGTLQGQLTMNTVDIQMIENIILNTEVLLKKYTVVCTNPPYLNKMNGELKEYIINHYKDYSGDLFSVFMYKNFDYCKSNGYSAFMTPFVWMFIKTYEKLREFIINQKSITGLIQMEYSAFEEATVPICCFILKNSRETERGLYFKLSEFKGGMEIQKQKVLEALSNKNCGYFYETSGENFSKIPGSPIAYWVSEKMLSVFEKGIALGEIAKPRQGMATSDNNRFLRLWYEVNKSRIGLNCKSSQEAIETNKKWFPYNKGGEYRKWYGNNDFVVDWENDGKNVKDYAAELYRSYSRTIKNIKFYFKKSITWTMISSSKFGVRFSSEGFIFDIRGSSIFLDDDRLYYILGFLSSTVAWGILKLISPTISFEVGTIALLPMVNNNDKRFLIDKLVQQNISIAQTDWDSFETSWDFITHPLITFKSGAGYADTPTDQWQYRIKDAFQTWESNAEAQFNTLKANEEELNRIFIDIYGLQEELTSEVEEKDVTVRKADLTRDIKSFVSYAVGCMFGRYSLDREGLAYAGGDWDASKYTSFIPDVDNIILLTEDEYFTDDVVNRFVEFVKVVYGEETLEENLDFIAKALGNKGNTSREVIRNYFIKDFYKDHCKIYQKRPIYWLFDSGKQNGFKAFIYMHRYNADTIGNLRIDYLHRLQKVYESEIARMQDIVDNSNNAKESTAAAKRRDKLVKQLQETKEYDQKIAHLALARTEIDLDDGVKVNYEKIQTGTDGKKLEVLAKI